MPTAKYDIWIGVHVQHLPWDATSNCPCQGRYYYFGSFDKQRHFDYG
jgi:hypothetical protein